MRVYLRRLIFILVLAVIVTYLYSKRDTISLLSNNKAMIQGEWYLIDSDFKEDELYTFSERMIDKNGQNWGTFLFRENDVLEVSLGSQATTYVLEFPDDDNMIWYIQYEGELKPSLRWRR